METHHRVAVALALAAIALTARAAPQERVVRGVVVDVRGAPVAGATVVLSDRETEGVVLGQTTTDASGSFEIRARPSRDSYVRVAHGGFPEALAHFNPQSPLRITLRHAFRIRGVALKRHGTPFAGAHVEVLASGLAGNERRSIRATTRDDGSFAIDGVHPGFLEVRLIDRTGRILIDAAHVQPSAVPESGLVTVKFTRRPVHVRGRIRWSGAPLPDALVYPSRGVVTHARPSLRPPELSHLSDAEWPVTLTGQDGLFEMFLLPGPVSLAVERRDRTRDYGHQMIEIPDEEEYSLDLDLAPTLSGVVVDKATGEGIGGAALQVAVQSETAVRGPRAWWHLTGSDGSFSLNLEPGDYVVRPRVKHYDPVQLAVSVWSGPHPDVRLELTRALAINGRVLVPSHVSPDELYGNPRFVLARAADGRHTEEGSFNEDGTFSVGGLFPVAYSLCVGSREWGWAVATGVAPGTDDVTLVIQAPGYVDLVVKDRAGRPVEGAFATVVSISKAAVAIPDQNRLVSDATGRLRLTVPAGALELSVFSQANKQRLEVEVEPAGTVHLEVELSEPRGLPR